MFSIKLDRLSTYLNAIVYETTPVSCWPQVRVLFGAGHFDSPHRLPGLIELVVNWVYSRMMWRYCVAHISWYTMLLVLST